MSPNFSQIFISLTEYVSAFYLFSVTKFGIIKCFDFFILGNALSWVVMKSAMCRKFGT